MKIDKSLIIIIGVCYIAEPFFIHLNNFFLLILSKILNVRCAFSYGGFGTLCNVGNSPSSIAIMHLLPILTVFIFSVIGFVLSKKGVVINSLSLTLTGALLFYSALHQTLLFLLTNIRYNFLKNIFFVDNIDNRPLEYFGNWNNVSVIYFLFNIFCILIYVFMAYQIIFKMWDRAFRIKIFTVGLFSCLIGNILWYFWLGKFIYTFFGLKFYS